jgi:hypothetical protein
MKENITIGLIIEVDKQPLWISRVIEQLLKSDFIDIELILYNTCENTWSTATTYPILYGLHKKLDRFLTRNRADYEKKDDLPGVLQGIPAISVDSDFIQDSRIRDDIYFKISRFNLDIILNFSSLILIKPGHRLARYGIWQYRIEPWATGGEEIICYWKSIIKDPVIETVVECSNIHDHEVISLHRSWIPTNFNSIHLNLDHALGMCSVIIPRLVKGFYLYGVAYFSYLRSNTSKTEIQSNAQNHYPPSNIQALQNMIHILFRYLYRKIIIGTKWKWFLLFSADRRSFPDSASTFQALIPPRDRFWADPFVVCQNGKRFIFIEEVIYSTNKGHIALLEMNSEGKIQQVQKILEKPYHLSYPFVFLHDNNYYMIPESSANKSIELYRCKDFPVKWEHVMNLASNINAKDTTVIYHRNKWWLFTAINDFNNFEEYVELYLFYANDLFTEEWISHPCNPVVTDIRTARPAGRIFEYRNKLYRPSQDCSARYGKALNLNQIVELNEESYKEILVSRTEATWIPNLKGTHTFNFDKDFSIIDVYKI